MRLAGLVAALHDAIDPDAAMADVAALCEHDRFQASAGLAAAADLVAERAAAAGLADVTVRRFPADGARRWWTFAAPLAWTPRHASAHVDGVPVLRYPEQPYALALCSAPCPPTRLPLVRWTAGERPDPAGALVVLDDVPLPVAHAELAGRRAVGVVADPLTARADRLPGQVGRLELPHGSPLFAFSATAGQLATLRRAAADRAPADVVVDVDTGPGTTPVVTGVLPGTTDAAVDGELLLAAHVCHPRPSANDNASGTAALLAIARACRDLGGAVGGGRAIRFVWGAEFVGMAAYLHDVVAAGHAPRPVAAVNVDMAGEDQRRCGGPLVIERAPDELPSPVSAVAERCAALLPPAARSYSGATACDTWSWQATPYVGASDHAMLAARPTACPAISVGHWPDVANHTSADTIDLVDPHELRRAATIAGATVLALRGAGGSRADAELTCDVVDTTVAWAAGRVLSALPGARPAPPPTPDASGDVLDPWAEEHAALLVQHRAAVARAAVRSLRDLAAPAAVVDRAVEWVTGLARHADATVARDRAATASGLARRPDVPRDTAGIPCDTTRAPRDVPCDNPDVPGDTPGAPAAVPAPRSPGGRRDALVPLWDGPFNLRRLGELAEPDDARWLADVTARDRGGSYARLLAIARALDGDRDTVAVAWRAALTSELAVPLTTVERLLAMLCRVGWAAPATTAGGTRGGSDAGAGLAEIVSRGDA